MFCIAGDGSWPRLCENSGEAGMLAEECEPGGLVGGEELGKHQPLEHFGEHGHGQQEGWHDSQRFPSKAMPPPGTIMWTCG
jgi:hypothetical protein